MSDASEMIDLINQHIDDGKALHISQAVAPFSWEVVVNHLQACADGEYFGTPYDNLGYQLNQAEEIPEVRKIMDYFNDKLKLKIFDAHIFTSLTKKSKTAVHTDNHNVLLWSISGNMLVHLYDDIDTDPFYTIEFNKGDLVYIPADVLHRIEPLGARAVVSFGVEVSPGVFYNSDITNPYTKINNNDQEAQLQING